MEVKIADFRLAETTDLKSVGGSVCWSSSFSLSGMLEILNVLLTS
jgi:hypothetical protein